jgi:septum formation protein
MLKAVGLTFSVVPSGVEEDKIKTQLQNATIAELAIGLARAKTLAVSTLHPNAYTIGADQLCVQGDRIFSKPGSYERAEAQLAELAGKNHEQHCGIVLAKGSEVLWTYHGAANLTVRPLTSTEIRAYVAADAPLASCGAYKFEGLGRHLFSHVEGDHDIVQGLALIPLLAELHARRIIALA